MVPQIHHVKTRYCKGVESFRINGDFDVGLVDDVIAKFGRCPIVRLANENDGWDGELAAGRTKRIEGNDPCEFLLVGCRPLSVDCCDCSNSPMGIALEEDV